MGSPGSAMLSIFIALLLGITLLVYIIYGKQGLTHTLDFQRPFIKPAFNAEYWDKDFKYFDYLVSLREGCKLQIRHSYRLNTTQISPMFYYSAHTNLSICKVPKSGSTFWTKIYFYFEKLFDPNKLLKMPRSEIHVKSRKHQVGFKTIVQLNTRNIVVSRNPYSRLYSAYIDKFYLLGFVDVAKTISKGSFYKDHGQKCGYNCSFQDFLDHVTTTAIKGKHINNHWSPVYLSCRACEIDYHYVVKQESLTEDTQHVFDGMNLTSDDRKYLHKLSRGPGENVTLAGTIVSLLKQREIKRKDCPSVVLFIKKLWTALQIQGYIRGNITFPISYFTDDQTIEFGDVINVVLATMARHPLSSAEKKAQRHRHLVSAFSSVNQNTIKKIQAMYMLDFILFDYDKSPPR